MAAAADEGVGAVKHPVDLNGVITGELADITAALYTPSFLREMCRLAERLLQRAEELLHRPFRRLRTTVLLQG